MRVNPSCPAACVNPLHPAARFNPPHAAVLPEQTAHEDMATEREVYETSRSGLDSMYGNLRRSLQEETSMRLVRRAGGQRGEGRGRAEARCVIPPVPQLSTRLCSGCGEGAGDVIPLVPQLSARLCSGCGEGAADADQYEAGSGDGPAAAGEGHPREAGLCDRAAQTAGRDQGHQHRDVHQDAGTTSSRTLTCLHGRTRVV